MIFIGNTYLNSLTSQNKYLLNIINSSLYKFFKNDNEDFI